MNLLAIETSGREGSIALHVAGRGIVERQLASEGRRHAQTLVADIDLLLTDNGIRPRDIECVAVSVGPGSFTGLRVGVVFAKTFSWLNNCHIVAVPTFEAIAVQVAEDAEHICVIADAQRNEFFLGQYSSVSGVVHPRTEITIESRESVLAAIREDSNVTGPGLHKLGEDSELPGKPADASARAPGAAAVAMLGRVAAEESDFADAWHLEPFYLRRSAAEEKRDAAARALEEAQ